MKKMKSERGCFVKQTTDWPWRRRKVFNKRIRCGIKWVCALVGLLRIGCTTSTDA